MNPNPRKIGIAQDEWDSLREALIRRKYPSVIHVGLDEANSEACDVDTIDVHLEISLHIIHLDVGQGESTVILLLCEEELCDEMGLCPCLMAIVIDGGVATDGGGMLTRLLRYYRIEWVDAAVISHFDKDHVEGVTRLLTESARSWEVAEAKELMTSSVSLDSAGDEVAETPDPYIFTGLLLTHSEFDQFSGTFLEAKGSNVVSGLANAIKKGRVEADVVSLGDSLKLDCDADRGLFSMTCVAVRSAGEANSDEAENARSIAWLLRFGKYTYYTAGDLPSVFGNAEVEDALLDLGGEPLTAMKCGHHGSATCTSSKFLAKHKPRLAFISSGRQENFGHPNVATLTRLWQSPGLAAVYVTNSYYVRPYLDSNFEAAQLKSITKQLRYCLEALESWLSAFPICTERMQVQKLSEADYPVRVQELRKSFSEVVEIVRALIEKFVEKGGRPDKVVREQLAGLSDRLKGWWKTNKDDVGILTRGFTLEGGRMIRAELAPGSEARADAMKLFSALKGMLRDWEYWLDAEAIEVKAPPSFFQAGNASRLGTITMRMSLADADHEQRTCAVHIADEENCRYYHFGYDEPEVLEEAGPNAWSFASQESLLAIKPPNSPGKYLDFVAKRQRHYNHKRKRDEFEDNPIFPANQDEEDEEEDYE